MVKPAKNTPKQQIVGKPPRKRKRPKLRRFPLLRDRHSVAVRGAGISAIVPIGGKDRIPHLAKVLQNLHAQNYEPLEIIISEYGVRGQKHHNNKYGPSVRYFYTPGQELFNKSKAMNKGFMAAKYDICVLVDADVILPEGYLGSVERHLEGFDACFLLKRVLHTPTVKGLKHAIIPPINYVRDDNFNGASLGIRKQAYIKIGGMCERFEGYGYEDLEFWDRLRKMLKLNQNRTLDVLHLNHGHAPNYDKHWAKNQKIWNELAGEPPESRARRFRKRLEAYSDKDIVADS